MIAWTLYKLYAEDELVYVGITSVGSRRFDRHRHERDWWPSITRAEFEHFETKAEAEEAERALIHDRRPQGNFRSKSQVPPDMWSTKQLAEWLSITRATVWALVRRDKLPVAGRTERGEPYFDPAETEAWVRLGKAALPLAADRLNGATGSKTGSSA